MDQESKKSNTVYIITIIVAIIGVIGTITGAVIGANSNARIEDQRQQFELTKRSLELTERSLILVATQGGSTQISSQNTVDAFEQLSSTSTPTSVVIPPTLTSTPDPRVFVDDFELGIKSEWDIAYGDIGMSQGRFSVLSPFDNIQKFHLAILNSVDYDNVRIEINLSKFSARFDCFDCIYSGAAAILIRYDPNGTSIGLIIMPGPNTLAFGTFDRSGNWSVITTTMADGWVTNDFNLTNSDNKISVEANGNTYFAYINNKLVTSASIPGIISGKVGLWFQNSGVESHPEAYAPRFDDFRSEPLP